MNMRLPTIKLWWDGFTLMHGSLPVGWVFDERDHTDFRNVRFQVNYKDSFFISPRLPLNMDFLGAKIPAERAYLALRDGTLTPTGKR